MSHILIALLCLLPTFCLSAKETKKEQYQLSATAIFCNEARFLREWIEYHQLIGIEHFYLYNNLSTDHYKECLAPYIEKGVVDLIEWPNQASNWGEWDQIQIASYRDAIDRAKKESRWLAIIDIDEFIVPVNDLNLATLLKKHEKDGIGGICLMWSFFGTSHVEKIPEDKLLIETLVLHSGPAAGGKLQHVWNQGAYKSIVRPKYVKGIGSPHNCDYVKGRKHEMLSFNKVHINHYWTRDNDFFMNVKIPRRKAWGQDPESALSWAADMNGSRENNPILRFIPQLRKRIMKD